MKKLILVLTVAFMLMAGTAQSATYNCIMYASENDGNPYGEGGMAGPPITSDYYFTIETDNITGEIAAFTNLFGAHFSAYEYGGWNTDDGAPFDAGEQILKDGVTYNVADIVFDGNPVSEPGHGLWFKGQSNPLGVFGGLVFTVGILSTSFDGSDGEIGFGPAVTLQEKYVFHLAPILAADAGPNLTITRGEQTTTVIEGSAFDPDGLPLTYRWIEGVDELSSWQDVGENGEAYLDLGSVPPLSMGDHALVLEISDGVNVVSDDMILTINNSIPVADAGSDQTFFDSIILDGGASFDPDGVIELYQWTLLHREDSLHDQTAQGQNPTIEGLEPGFYDVTLMVTDDDGVTDTDTMLLAAAGPCKVWPQPNADLNIRRFNITNIKRNNHTFTNMLGSIDLPDLDLHNADTVESRITIELFNALKGGGDVVISNETTLSIKDKPRTLQIKK